MSELERLKAHKANMGYLNPCSNDSAEWARHYAALSDIKDELERELVDARASQWISVEDRLPLEAGFYLISGQNVVGEYVHESYFKNGEFWMEPQYQTKCKGQRYGNDVLAWMPLPQPYYQPTQTDKIAKVLIETLPKHKTELSACLKEEA